MAIQDAVLALKVPTRMAVTKLEEHFTNLQPGELISWNEIEKVIGEPKDSNRFKNITGAWRKIQLQERNILLSAVGNGLGLIVADSKRRIDEASSRVKRGRKQVAKAIYIAYGTNPEELSEGDRYRREKIVALSRDNNAMIKLMNQCRRELPSGESRDYLISELVGANDA